MPPRSLSLTVEADQIYRFFPLLERGVMVKVQTGCSIKTMLCNQLGLRPEYIEGRIESILLDGKAVDSIDSAIPKAGSTVALSAAMPGLAGAALRRGGYLASLRSQITYRKEPKSSSGRKGAVVLKLFNLLLGELGPKFLTEGISVGREDLKGFLINLPDEFWTRYKGARVDGQEVDLGHLLEMKWLDNYDLVMLRVDCSNC